MTGVVWVRAAAVAIAGALVGGGVATVLTADVEASLGPVAAAWVDQPLHASNHPMGPIEVTVHATDVDTVVAVRVTIGGEMAADIDIIDPVTLVWETFEWTPDAPGEYQLEVVGIDPNGDRGMAGVATFTVGGAGGEPTDPDDVAEPDASTTSSVTSTTMSTSTTTTTSTPSPTIPPPSSPTTGSTSTSNPAPPTTPSTTSCSPSTPTVTGADTESINSSGATVRITWSYSGCAPDGFRITVESPTEDTVTKNVGTADRAASVLVPTCADYSVRVRALGSVDSPQSAPFSFRTDCG